MRRGLKSDRDLVMEIITDAFEDNPGVNWLIRGGRGKRRRIRRLSRFAFEKSLNRDGVFVSDNERGVALCYVEDGSGLSFKELLLQIKFALLSIRWDRLRSSSEREKYRKSIRLTGEPYLYFWFLGVLKDGRGAIYDLKDGIFEEAQARGLPIYIETAMERNKVAYERYGFKAYHHWKDDDRDIEFWFMKWEPT